MASYILAVDGGATKTGAELLTAAGMTLARARTGPCNLYRDVTRGIASVDEAWRRCCAAAGLDPEVTASLTCLSAGMAGLTAAGAASQFRAAFTRFARVALSGDGYTALIGAFGGLPGALISIGTGVIGCRLGPDGAYRSASGWGFPIGDRGGGAWLGFTLIGAWLEWRDFYPTRRPSPLWSVVQAALGDDQPEILAWLQRAPPQDYAAFAPAIIEAAAAGESFAASLLDQAALHIVDLAHALDISPALRLALAGGLAPVLASRIVAALGTDRVAVEATASPLRGAWLIGAGHAAPELACPEGVGPNLA